MADWKIEGRDKRTWEKYIGLCGRLKKEKFESPHKPPPRPSIGSKNEEKVNDLVNIGLRIWKMNLWNTIKITPPQKKNENKNERSMPWMNK